MKTKDINDMTLPELRIELINAKKEGNEARIKRVRRRIEHENQDIERCLNTWPKAKNFKIAMNLVVAEGKAVSVIMDNRIVHEIDMAEVIIKLFDMAHESANFKARTLSEILKEYGPLLLNETQEESELDYAEYRDGNQ